MNLAGHPFPADLQFSSSVRFLYAALIATAIIHGTYLGSLYRRYRGLRKHLKQLGKQ